MQHDSKPPQFCFSGSTSDPGDTGDAGDDDATPTDSESDLDQLERLVGSLRPGEPAPIAQWLARLEPLLESGGLEPEEHAQLNAILVRLRELEARAARSAMH